MARIWPFIKELFKVVGTLGVIIGLVAIGLRVLNTIPLYIQGEPEKWPKHYRSIEEAETSLGIRIRIPYYFPVYLEWPPSLIKADHLPALTLSLDFLYRGKEELALSIHQIISERETLPQGFLEAPRGWQETSVNIKGRAGSLAVGKNKEGKDGSRISWREYDRYLILESTLPPEELIRIARTMGH